MTPLYLLRFPKKSSGHLIETLVCFVATDHLDIGEISTALSSEFEKNLAPDEILFLCGKPLVKELSAAWEGREMSAALSRLRGDTSVEFISYDKTGQEVGRKTMAGTPATSPTGLDEILRRGATRIFNERGGFVEPNSSYHFENPSGRHTDRFMRLSNLLTRQSEIAFLALAVMRHLPANARFAYIDTPALYAIVSAVNEQWRFIAPSRRPLVADNFGSYGGAVKFDFDQKDGAIVLISASSSGGLASRLIEEQNFSPSAILHVLYLGKNTDKLSVAINLACDTATNPEGIVEERETFTKGMCLLCDRGSKAIPLQGDQFDIRGPPLEPLIIKQSDAPRSLDENFARLATTQTLQVKSSRTMLWIDAETLLAVPAYRDRLDFFTRRHVPAGVQYCIIDKEQTRPFAECVAEIAKGAFKVLTRDQIESIEVPADELIDPFLVIVDVIASGRSLLEISRDLRNVCPKASIIYLVGFGKITSSRARELLKSNLVQTHHAAPHAFEIVEEMVLPSADLANAWLDELDFLQSTQDSWVEAVRPILEARLARLRNSAKPMIDDIFVANSDKQHLALQEGFAFWKENRTGASHADVFFTIASILQRLRTKPSGAGTQALRTNWLQQTLLSPENFGRYNDGIIQASILRASNPAELDFQFEPTLSADAGRIIRRVIEAADRQRGDAATEFLLALCTGRLTLSQQDLRTILEPLASAPPMIAWLLEMLRVRRLKKLSSDAKGTK